ncbi:9214_t:CDS:2 [Entrophospora sp. SA101]|nr:9214_t:CDS:2 [Entrophospora sp. SA101]
MGLYITRMYGSKYPAVEDLGIGATNAGKKVMRRGWVDREKVSVTLPNIFELGKLKSLPRYLNETFTNFVVIDKPEYDLVLGSSWLTGRGIDIDFYGYKICRNELWEKKGKCYWREDSIEILPRSLHIFYEMLFPKLIRIDRDGDIILTCFSDKNMKNSLIDLTVEDLGIGATNAGKKVMRRGWVDREKVSVTLPNIFELGKLKSLPRYLNETFTNFVVIDKPEYDLVLGSSWLTGRGIDIDFYGYKICRNELWEKKGKCYWREDSIEILPRSLHIFYEMLFPKLIGIDRDGDIILTRFSDKNMKNSLIDLRKIPVKALIDTSSKFNTISRCLFDKLEEYYGIRDPLRWYRSNRLSNSPENCSHHAKIVIDGMSIPLNGEYSRPTGDSLSHKTSSTKNNLSKSMESKPGLAQEEAINIINKILSGTQNIKHQKSHRGIFHNIPPAPPTPRRLNDDVSKNKSKKNRVNYSTDSDTSSNSDISDSSDSSLTRLRSELINMHKTSSAKKRPIKRRRCKVKRKKLVRSTMSRYNGPQGAMS